MDERVTAAQIKRSLPDTRGKILESLLAGTPESEIARDRNISKATFRKHVSLLYDDFRKVLPAKGPGQRNNLRELMSLFSETLSSSSLSSASEIYIPHSEIEEICHRAIERPGGLLRIEAPPKMGKTTLLDRCLKEFYRNVRLDFKETVDQDLKNLDSFLQWFCFSIAADLGIDPLPKDLSADGQKTREQIYWDQNFLGNAKIKAKKFFEENILSDGEVPLVIGLDGLEKIYRYENITLDFLQMLRVWHELGVDSRNKWENLRLILTYVGEFPIENNYSSPFNVGECVTLPALNQEQIEELFKKSSLDIGGKYINKIIEIIGGHPYLLKTWIERIKEIPIELARSIIEDDNSKYELKMEFLELTKELNDLETKKVALDKREYLNKSNEINRDKISKVKNSSRILFSGNNAN